MNSMPQNVFLLFILVCFLSLNASSQEIFKLDFEEEFVPEEWTVNRFAEWGHLLGPDSDNFFRFHPKANLGLLKTPSLTLEEGVYTLYFKWSESGTSNPDFINIRIQKNNGQIMEVSDFGGLEGGATNRE